MDPDDVQRLRTFLTVADACFRRGADLGQEGFALVWRVTVLRGSGHYKECTTVFEEAKKADKASSKDLADAEGIVSKIAQSYAADLQWIGSPEHQWIIPPGQYFRPQLLRNIEPVAQRIYCALGLRATAEPIHIGEVPIGPFSGGAPGVPREPLQVLQVGVERCPKCGFSCAFDGESCTHCGYSRATP